MRNPVLLGGRSADQQGDEALAGNIWRHRLGTLGFGGPIAPAGYMQRDRVERRRWLSKQDYVEGLAFVTAWTESEIIWLFLASGALAMWVKAPPKWVKASRVLGQLPLPLRSISGLIGPASAAASWTLGWYLAVPALLTKFKKVQEPLLIVAAGVVGWLLRGVTAQ